METRKKIVGETVNWIDGLLKATGAAEYATDYKISNTAFAVIFKSEIAAGKIIRALSMTMNGGKV